MRRMLLMNGPNLDMLGTREPEVYGSDTLASLEEMAMAYAQGRGVALTPFQSNSESQLVNKIHAAAGSYEGIVFNPGAHTHYSYAIRDAIGSVDVPVVEVHISDISEREAFRNVSVTAPACVAQVKGLGFEGYCRAIDILCDNGDLPRLGEGFETRYPVQDKIVVAGRVSPHVLLDQGVQPIVAPFPGGGQPPAPAQPAAEQPPAGQPDEPRPSDDLPAEAPAEAPGNMPDGLRAEAAAKAVAEAVAEAVPPEAFPAETVPAEPAAAMASPQADVAAHTPARSLAEAEDFAAPYAPDVAAVDAGLVSFERQERVREACRRLGLDALMVRDTSNIRWLTAFDGVFDEERAHSMLVAGGRSGLHTDTRYSNALRAEAQRIASDIVVDDTRIGHAGFARSALAFGDRPFTGRLGIEDSITYAEFVQMVEALGAANLAATTDVVRGLRAVKDRSELSRMLAAQAVTDAAFVHIVGFMRPGMTERQVQLELDDFMMRHGGEGLAFSSIVATGANGADPHAIPGGTRLEAGQCVVMDFGAKAFGYCSDMTRVVFLGQPDAEKARAWEVLRCANETVEALLRPGVTGKEAHETAERVLAEGGFAGKMGHGLGHGVGLDVHELPVLNTRNDKPLVEGNVVTVEPGIYLPGNFGMRLEDCGVVTSNGYEVFSQIGHDMVVL